MKVLKRLREFEITLKGGWAIYFVIVVGYGVIYLAAGGVIYLLGL